MNDCTVYESNNHIVGSLLTYRKRLHGLVNKLLYELDCVKDIEYTFQIPRWVHEVGEGGLLRSLFYSQIPVSIFVDNQTARWNPKIHPFQNPPVVQNMIQTITQIPSVLAEIVIGYLQKETVDSDVNVCPLCRYPLHEPFRGVSLNCGFQSKCVDCMNLVPSKMNKCVKCASTLCSNCFERSKCTALCGKSVCTGCMYHCTICDRRFCDVSCMVNPWESCRYCSFENICSFCKYNVYCTVCRAPVGCNMCSTFECPDCGVVTCGDCMYSCCE